MAAENEHRVLPSTATAPASMRPRRMAAENAEERLAQARAVRASMRPRRMAAENGDQCPIVDGGRRRFNEAAAHGRGKPRSVSVTTRGGSVLQ